MQYVVKKKKEIHLPGKTYREDEVVELPERVAMRYLEQGAVERYETKVIRERPLEDAGGKPSVSPADQASTKPMSKPSKRGGKKKAGA